MKARGEGKVRAGQGALEQVKGRGGLLARAGQEAGGSLATAGHGALERAKE